MITGLYARLIGVGLIVAALLGAFWYVKHLQGQVADLRQEVAVKEASIRQLSTAIDTQNAAIDSLKKDADARLAAAEAALVKARADTAAAKKKAGTIFKAKPSDPSNLCKSALDLVNGGAK